MATRRLAPARGQFQVRRPRKLPTALASDPTLPTGGCDLRDNCFTRRFICFCIGDKYRDRELTTVGQRDEADIVGGGGHAVDRRAGRSCVRPPFPAATNP